MSFPVLRQCQSIEGTNEIVCYKSCQSISSNQSNSVLKVKSTQQPCFLLATYAWLISSNLLRKNKNGGKRRLGLKKVTNLLNVLFHLRSERPEVFYQKLKIIYGNLERFQNSRTVSFIVYEMNEIHFRLKYLTAKNLYC